jgi:hypothetical protein
MHNMTAALNETSQTDLNAFIASKSNTRTNKSRNHIGCGGLEEVGVVKVEPTAGVDPGRAHSP